MPLGLCTRRAPAARDGMGWRRPRVPPRGGCGVMDDTGLGRWKSGTQMRLVRGAPRASGWFWVAVSASERSLLATATRESRRPRPGRGDAIGKNQSHRRRRCSPIWWFTGRDQIAKNLVPGFLDNCTHGLRAQHLKTMRNNEVLWFVVCGLRSRVLVANNVIPYALCHASPAHDDAISPRSDSFA